MTRKYGRTYRDIKEVRGMVKRYLPNATVDRSDVHKGIYRIQRGDGRGPLKDCRSVAEAWLTASAWLDYMGGC
jgi:hypothetical protein